jgi:hypothetical protein
MSAAFADRLGRTIYVYAEPPSDLSPEPLFWIATRAITKQDLAARAALPDTGRTAVTIATRKRLIYCPWCGRKLSRFYKRRYHALVDESVAKEFTDLVEPRDPH